MRAVLAFHGACLRSRTAAPPGCEQVREDGRPKRRASEVVMRPLSRPSGRCPDNWPISRAGLALAGSPQPVLTPAAGLSRALTSLEPPMPKGEAAAALPDPRLRTRFPTRAMGGMIGEALRAGIKLGNFFCGGAVMLAEAYWCGWYRAVRRQSYWVLRLDFADIRRPWMC